MILKSGEDLNTFISILLPAIPKNACQMYKRSSVIYFIVTNGTLFTFLLLMVRTGTVVL